MSAESSFQWDVSIPPGSEALRQRLLTYPQDAMGAMARGMDKGLQLLLGVITRERFTGEGPFPVSDGRLGVKTNRLRLSLRSSASEIEGDTVKGALGSNTRYFGVHEEGFEGDVNVRSFTRQVSPTQFTKKGGGLSKEQRKTKASRETALGTETVKAHTRHMRMPARGPMRHGIADHGDIVPRELSRALKAFWEKGAA